jgi:predicted metal-binding protein
MKNKVKLGVIICGRYQTCAGGKCFRALRDRTGAFEAYSDCEVEVVGFTTCGGCPGGNIEYALFAHQKSGVTARLIVKFLLPVAIDKPAVVKAWMREYEPPLYVLESEIEQNGKVVS